MGTTFACAQCHDHKYDPFSQQEYFQFFAFFNNTADGGSSTSPVLPLPTAEQVAKEDEIQRDDQTSSSARSGEEGQRLEPVEAAGTEDRRAEKATKAIQPVTTMVMEELENHASTHVSIRGSHNVKGAVRSLPAFPRACIRFHRISRPIAWAWHVGWSILAIPHESRDHEQDVGPDFRPRDRRDRRGLRSPGRAAQPSWLARLAGD